MVAVLLLLVCFLSACNTSTGSGDNGDDAGGPGPTISRPTPEGEPRNVQLGFSTVPAERTTESYISAFATAAQYADLVLIQRNVPWAEFMAGGRVSAETTATTRLETDLRHQYGDMTLFYGIDPTDGAVQRTRIANLPPTVDPEVGFNDPRLREAFIAYTTYVVRNYEPEYLALGVEVNMLYARKPEQFNAFVSLYKEAYEVAKANRPETKIFPTFQLEDLEGTFAEIHPPQWEVLDYFSGYMDALAISTYPFLGDIDSAAGIREDYFSQLGQYFDGEILIAETGYPSAPVDGHPVVGSEEDQAAYLQRLLTEAEANGFSIVVWLAALDPAFAREGVAATFGNVGLRASDGSNKLAWPEWEAWARRPLATEISPGE